MAKESGYVSLSLDPNSLTYQYVFLLVLLRCPINGDIGGLFSDKAEDWSVWAGISETMIVILFIKDFIWFKHDNSVLRDT